MAVKAISGITITDQTDASALVTWYKMTDSSSPPSAPSTTDATVTPSGWSRNEPTVTSAADLDKYAYACLQTVWGDSTCSWGTVTLSASFEAAKQAAKSATDYITDITNDGIWVTPSTAKPSSGQAVSSTSGWHIADALELFKSGASMFKVWFDSVASMTKVRVGGSDNGHMLLDDDGLYINAVYPYNNGYQTVEKSRLTKTDGLKVWQSDTHAGYGQLNGGSLVLNDADSGMGGGSIHMGSTSNGLDISYLDDYASTAFTVDGENLLSYTNDANYIRVGSVGGCPVRVYSYRELFSGTYSTTHNSAIELDVPASIDDVSFQRLLVEYEDSTGRKGSVWVGCGLGDTNETATFGTQTTTANSSTGMVIRTKTYVLAYDTNAAKWKMNTATYSANVYQYGKVTIGTNGAATWSSAEEIGITKVIGYY